MLNRGQEGYGFLLGFFGLGAVVGASLVTFLGRYFRERDIIKYSTLVFGLLMVIMSYCRIFSLCMILSLGLGISVLMMSATTNTVLQSRVERSMRGRIMSFYILVFQGMLPLGGFAIGFLSDRTSAPFAVLVAGIICVCLGLVTIVVPSILRDAIFQNATPTKS